MQPGRHGPQAVDLSLAPAGEPMPKDMGHSASQPPLLSLLAYTYGSDHIRRLKLIIPALSGKEITETIPFWVFMLFWVFFLFL